MRHVAIVLARNEERFIGRMLRSLLDQTEPPDRVCVVDDGSTDGTAEIVADLARAAPSLHLLRRPARAERMMADGVVGAFDEAYALCRDLPSTYVSRLDADVELPPRYFETVLGHLDAHPEWGAAGGVPVEEVGGRTKRWRMARTHVPGALKTYRRDVFDRMGGLTPTCSWDIVDLVKVRALGYRTGWLDVEVPHLRRHGSAIGVLRGRAEWGEAAWIIGTHPLFAAARGLLQTREPPYLLCGLAFGWGYLRAALRRAPRLADRDLVRALRREQLRRLLRLDRLPSGA